jgi:hypothetical protein
VQLLEGYAEYAVPRVTARLGRQVIPSRLGMTGFDGAGVTVRDAPHGIELQGYGGWGLARGAALPVTSPVLDPLDDFQPLERQLIVGVGGGWTSARVDTRVEYQREVDPHFNKFVSERVGFDGALRPTGTCGSPEAQIATWRPDGGEREASVAARHARVRGTLGARRYAHTSISGRSGEPSVPFRIGRSMRRLPTQRCPVLSAGPLRTVSLRRGGDGNAPVQRQADGWRAS